MRSSLTAVALCLMAATQTARAGWVELRWPSNETFTAAASNAQGRLEYAVYLHPTGRPEELRQAATTIEESLPPIWLDDGRYDFRVQPRIAESRQLAEATRSIGTNAVLPFFFMTPSYAATNVLVQGDVIVPLAPTNLKVSDPRHLP